VAVGAGADVDAVAVLEAGAGADGTSVTGADATSVTEADTDPGAEDDGGGAVAPSGVQAVRAVRPAPAARSRAKDLLLGTRPEGAEQLWHTCA
jgi:hypothetical protein